MKKLFSHPCSLVVFRETQRMVKQSIFGVFGGVFILGAQVLCSKEKVGLTLKFEPGKTYVSESVISQKSAIPMMGETSVEMKMLTAQTASQEGENVKVVQKSKSVKMDISMAGVKSSLDSEDPDSLDPSNPIAGLLSGLMNVSSTIQLSPKGEIISVEAESAPGMETMGFGEVELKQSARELFDMLPSKSVAIGESWESESKMPLPEMFKGDVVVKYTHTFKGMEKVDGHELAKIVFTGKIDEKDENLSVTSKKIGGEILFDAKIGQPRKVTTESEIVIGLAEGGGMTIPMTSKSMMTLKEIK